MAAEMTPKRSSSLDDEPRGDHVHLGLRCLREDGFLKVIGMAMLLLLRRASDDGRAIAPAQIDMRYSRGIGVDGDMEEAVRLFGIFYARESNSGTVQLGLFYLQGRGVTKDWDGRARLLQLAATAGSFVPLIQVGLCCPKVNELGKNFDQDVFRQASTTASKDAHVDLRKWYKTGCVVLKNEGEAAQLIKLSFTVGNCNAMAELIRCFQWGFGVVKDITATIHTFRCAMKDGHWVAHVSLDLCFEHEREMKKHLDETTGIRLNHLAAERNNIMGWTLNLCKALPDEVGTKHNVNEAIRYFPLAVADFCDSDIFDQLGRSYWNEQSVEKDEEQDVQFYCKSKNDGNSKEQVKRGFCYKHVCRIESDSESEFRLFFHTAFHAASYAFPKAGADCREGRGMSEDEEETVKVFRMSGKVGNSTANLQLGHCDVDDIGEPKNCVEVERFLGASAYKDGGDGRGYSEDAGEPQNIEIALDIFDKFAHIGNEEGWFLIGFMQQYGQEAGKDLDGTARMYLQTSRNRRKAAGANLGKQHMDDDEVEGYEAEAMRLLLDSADDGHAAGMVDLGIWCCDGVARSMPHTGSGYVLFLLAIEGNIYEQEPMEALRFFQMSAFQTSFEPHGGEHCSRAAFGIEELGKFLKQFGIGVEGDAQETALFVRAAATDGELTGDYRLGNYFVLGDSMKHIESETDRHWQNASSSGNSEAQTMLGFRQYAFGCDEAHEGEAFKIFRIAGSRECSDAQMSLPKKICERKLGMEHNPEERKSFFPTATEDGQTTGQVQVGIRYRDGVHPMENETKTEELFRATAEFEKNSELSYHGFYYRGGPGDEKDSKGKAELLRIAVSEGDQDSHIYFEDRVQEHSDDANEGIRLLCMAASAGSSTARVQVGMMLERSHGVEKYLEAAVGVFQHATLNGDSNVQTQLGVCFRDGLGVDRNEKVALDLFTRAADAGNSAGTLYLGFCYRDGVGVERDYAKAVEMFQNSVDKGEIDGQFALGICYLLGRGIQKDTEEAVRLFTLSANAGSWHAQCELGHIYREGRLVERDLEKAVALFRLATTRDYACANVELGKLYRDGLGVEEDVEEALQLFRNAADQENSGGYFELGVCFRDGVGIEQNDEEAVRFFEMAADAGNIDGMLQLGHSYMNGIGVEENVEEALRLYRLVAESGGNGGSLALGRCYYYGEGVPKNQEEGIRLFTISANSGNADAQFLLGSIYSEGRFIEEQTDDGETVWVWTEDDKKEASRLFRLAAVRGHLDALVAFCRLYEIGNEEEEHIEEVLGLVRSAVAGGHSAGKVKLGLCYRDGFGVEQDYQEATRLFREASNDGNKYADILLGLCYQRGDGVEKNLVEALRLFRQAAEGE